MDRFEYCIFLMENSHKESDRYWSRNSAFWVVQGLLINAVLSQHLSYRTRTTILIFGLILSILHCFVLTLSKHYNHTWFNAFKEQVRAQIDKQKKAQAEGPYIGNQQDKQEANMWINLKETLEEHDKKSVFLFKRSTDIAEWLVYILIAFWLLLLFGSF